MDARVGEKTTTSAPGRGAPLWLRTVYSNFDEGRIESLNWLRRPAATGTVWMSLRMPLIHALHAYWPASTFENRNSPAGPEVIRSGVRAAKLATLNSTVASGTG